jgi:hypothetical protein
MSAECKRLSPDHVGPTCGCPDGACSLESRDPDEEFDKANEEYVREKLGWEFDLLQISQKADEEMRDA